MFLRHWGLRAIDRLKKNLTGHIPTASDLSTGYRTDPHEGSNRARCFSKQLRHTVDRQQLDIARIRCLPSPVHGQRHYIVLPQYLMDSSLRVVDNRRKH